MSKCRIVRAVPIGDGFDAALSAAQEGDERALEILYRDLAPSVLGYVRGRGAVHPEDVTSETFIGIVRNLATFRGGEEQFRSWVFTIAHRRLLDERRRLGRQSEHPHDPEDLVEVAGASVDSMIAPGQDESLVRLLDELTDEQRSVVLLRIVADLPFKQVAAVLGKREGAAKTLYRRALARLERAIAARPWLAELPSEESDTWFLFSSVDR